MKSRMQKSVEEQKSTEKDFNNLVKVAEIALLNTKEGEIIDFEKMMYESSYGKLNKLMQHTIDSFVKGKVVYDLGAGDLKLSKAMLSLGANQVYAIDKEGLHDPRQPIDKLTFFEGYFDMFIEEHPELPEKDAVAFVSWPANHKLGGLLDLMEKFETIIYLGKNTDGRSCGWPGFFHKMYLRPVLAHVPWKRNTLIIWGKHDDKLAVEHRQLVLEERAGGDHSKCYDFKENA